MHAVWMRARSELRGRLAAVLTLGLIAGLIGGVVIAAAAGARRTDTAYSRFLEKENGLDFEIDANAKTIPNAERALAQVARLPQVSDSAWVTLASGRFDLPKAKQTGFVFPLVSIHGGLGTRVNKVKILQGRMFDPNAPDEIVPSFVIADELGMYVGQTVRFSYGSPFGDPERLDKNPPPPVTLHVVGIGASPSMFKPLAG